MAETLHPMAPHALPPFITPPGETDLLFVGLTVAVLLAFLLLGVFYFALHALPERMAHGKADTAQFQIVGILALLALFTHNNLFWVAALLLAAVNVPDVTTPLKAIAESMERRDARRARRRVERGGAPAGDAADA